MLLVATNIPATCRDIPTSCVPRPDETRDNPDITRDNPREKNRVLLELNKQIKALIFAPETSMLAEKDLISYTQSLEKLRLYIEHENFEGYDPYDTLNSPLKFKYLGKFVAVLALQFQKRNPINIRPLLGIKKEHNPKAIGLFLYGYCKLQKLNPDKDYSGQIHFLFNHLKNNYSKGFSGYCWGYNFDWASGNKYIKRDSPNVVVTAFVAKGIFEYYQLTKNAEALSILKSIGNFILKDLPRTETNEGIYFSYTTLGVDRCYNASLLAAKVLAQLFYLTKEEDYKDLATKAVDYVVSKQYPDGHWNYSIDEQGKERVQIDFHQGYVIDCIADVMYYGNIQNEKYTSSITKGNDFYRKEQFFENGQSKWRLPKEYPTEIHNQSQGIITFSKTQGYTPFATGIANWTIENMQDKNGFFYYRKGKSFTNKIPYMRWSQAWMFVALIELIISLEQKK
ncbi:MAG TPA: pectate lyase [Bacteroidia bacterium]